MSERLPAERPERDTGIRYPEETKERAYQLWAFLLGGNAEKVAAELAKLDPPVIVDGRTVRDWATRYQWAVRRADDWRRIAPDLSLQTVVETRYGLLEAARMARGIVASDDPKIGSRDRLAAGALLQRIEESLRTLAVQADHASARLPATTTPEEAEQRIAELRERMRR